MRDLRRPSGVSVGTRWPRVALGMLILVLMPTSWLHAAPGYRGRPLGEVLRELRDQGLALIFSSDVVTADLLVTLEPTGRRLREVLDEILHPLNLHSEDGPGSRVVILPGASDQGRLIGRVVSGGYGRAIPDATVRVRGTAASTVTDHNGYFDLRGLPPVPCEVTVSVTGFLPKTASARAARNPEPSLILELEPQPQFVTELVVTPGRHSLVREEQAVNHSVTGADAVLAPTIGGDISRVVELLPGIAAPDNSAAFHVRGSVSRDVSFVLDGLELYDAFHLESFQSPFSLIDNNVVDRIEFLGGGFTADLGDRHGGFVEVSTSTPGPEASGEVELGTLNSRVSYRAPMADPAGSWLLSLRAWYPEALVDSIALGGGNTLDPRLADLYGKTAFFLSERTLLSAHGLLGYNRVEFRETGEGDNENVDALSKTGYVWLRLLTTRPGHLTSETVLSGGRIERRRDGIAAPATGVVVVNDSRAATFWGLKSDLDWQASPKHVLRAGGEVRWLRGDYRYSNEFPDDPASSKSIRLDPDGTSIGVYATHRSALSSKLATELGLRWDRQTHTNDNQLSPRFNAVWRPGERSEIRLAVGRFNQSQRIHELQVEDDETTFSRAEVAEQAELSFQHEFENGWRLRIDGYYRKLSDLRPRYETLFEPIELFPETSDDRIMIAPSEARLQGTEIMLRGNPRHRFCWWVSYALSSADDKVDGTYVARSWDQTHAGKFLVGYTRDDRWSVSLTGTVHTGWPTTPVTAQTVTQPDGTNVIEPVLGPRNTDRFSTYARLDFKARRTFALPRGRLSLTVDVVNLTDRDNTCCVDRFLFEPQPDGSVDVRRDLDNWLGFTPSFTAHWSF